jgi:hypothetical protein
VTFTGGGTKDAPYQEYRNRCIQKLLDQAPPGAAFQLQLTIVGTSRGTFPLNLTEDEVEGVRSVLNSREGCRGCPGTCCTGAGSDPCTC